jgi:sigma-B regulation protein RsbU (phosphoserine phosphatase)
MISRDSGIYSKERLSMLFEISQAFNSSLELDEVLNKVMDEVIAATKAERGFVTLVDSNGKFEFKAARGIDQNTIDQPEFALSTGVVAKVTQSTNAILTNDAQEDERFSNRQSVIDLNLRSIMASPLAAKGEIIGVIYVDNKLKAGIFTEEDLDLLNAISSSAAVAIENARLYEVAVDKGRMDRELQMARKVQTSLIPSSVPDISGWEIAAKWVPAREVSGDFYDFIELGDDRFGLVIADVVDKGMAAALFMANSRSSLRASTISEKSPKQAVGHANQVITADDASGMFLTLVYAVIGESSGEMVYVNAGHNPPLLWRSGSNELQTLSGTGMMLGVDGASSYEENTVSLDSGDFVVFFTDGVTEAINAQEEEFGQDRLEKLLREYHMKSSASILEELEKAMSGFIGDVKPFDDVTIMVVKRT